MHGKIQSLRHGQGLIRLSAQHQAGLSVQLAPWIASQVMCSQSRSIHYLIGRLKTFPLFADMGEWRGKVIDFCTRS